MSRKFLIALLFSGYAYAAAPQISIKAILPANRPQCPFLDERVTVTYTDDDNEGKKAVLTISCTAAGAQQQTTRFTSQPVTVARQTQQPPTDQPKKPNDYGKDISIVPHNEAFARFTVDVVRTSVAPRSKINAPLQ